MTSVSDPIDSADSSSLYRVVPQEGEISSSNGGGWSAKSLSTKSKCAIVAFVIGGIAGIVIIGLGVTNMFGSLGSIGFIDSLVGGGVLTVTSAGSIIWIAIISCKNHKRQPNAAVEIKANSTVDDIDKVSDQGAVDRISKKEKSNISSKATYPEIGQEAIDFARQKLAKHLEIKPINFNKQPINQDIALLAALYWDVYFVAFEEGIKKYTDPWSHQEVIELADSLMKIGYAISCLTLEDLSEFTQALELNKGIKQTFVEALTIQNSYQYRTYYYCTEIYHWIRGGITWSKNSWTEQEGLYQPQKTPQEHVDLFYQEDTPQSKWRMLYNDYCGRIRLYVKEDVLIF